MKATNVDLKNNRFTATFTATIPSGSDPSMTNGSSTQYKIGGSVMFSMLVETVFLRRNYIKHFVFASFTKPLKPLGEQQDDCTYIIKFTSKALCAVDKCFTIDDCTYRLIGTSYESQLTFDVAVEIKLAPCANSFASLHEDTELTDFELRGEDGSVHMHRVVLAAASPVLRRMLGGEWRETSTGRVDVPGTSKATLQNFKNYIYLHNLPESGLEDLLLLSSYYMMPELEQTCVDKLVHNLSAANACDIIEFALKHKVTRLLLETLKSVKSNSRWFDDMLDQFTSTNIKSQTT